MNKQFLAWCIHCYTALGLVAAAGIAALLYRGGPDSFRSSFVLFLIAVVIDGTDGTLARWIRINKVLPGFDGRRLDDLIDFLNYTCLPLLLIWRAGLLSPEQAWLLVIPLLASAYGFCQVAIKTEDGYFLGFPSYWNFVAFYLYIFNPPEWLSVATLIVFSVLTFVPTRYLYPTQPGFLNRVTLLFSGLWMLLVLGILCCMPARSDLQQERDPGLLTWLAIISLFFPIYYLLASWTISVKSWRRKSREGLFLSPDAAGLPKP
jgi:phosphatidylcholine synthase